MSIKRVSRARPCQGNYTDSDGRAWRAKLFSQHDPPHPQRRQGTNKHVFLDEGFFKAVGCFAIHPRRGPCGEQL